jgi:uncharacterized protein
MRLLLLADTHVPARARNLPAEVWDEVGRADVVVHAGDWTSPDLLDQLSARSRRLLACWGNNDGPPLRARLPEVARATLEGVRVAVVHETGDAAGRDRRVTAAYPDADLVVFGHSHIPWDSAAARPTGGSTRLLNPGSPTDRRRQPRCTYLTLTLANGLIDDVVRHDLPLRLAHPAAPARLGDRSVPPVG